MWRISVINLRNVAQTGLLQVCQQTQRIREHGGESYRSTELDLMGPEILRMLRQSERGLPADDANIERRIKLRVF